MFWPLIRQSTSELQPQKDFLAHKHISNVQQGRGALTLKRFVFLFLRKSGVAQAGLEHSLELLPAPHKSRDCTYAPPQLTDIVFNLI